MVLLGGFAGAIFGVVAEFAGWKKLVDKESYFIFNLALTLMFQGGVELLGGDSLLAVFVAGWLQFSS